MSDNTGKAMHRYAGLKQRFWALLIDGIILSVIFFPITRLVKGTWIMGVNDHRWVHGWLVTDPLCLWFFLIIVLYFIILEGIAGATIGKMMMRIRVIGPDGGKPGLGKSIVRNLLRCVDSLPTLNILGVLLIVNSPENARFGDRVARTRVIRID